MIRYLADEHIPDAVVDGLTARGVDIVRVVDAGLVGTPDPALLAWAAGDDRVLVTFDRKTVPGFAYDRVRAGLPMAGVAAPDRTMTVGAMIDVLHLAAACGTADDIRDLVVYLPL